MKVSIIIPVHRSEQTIARSLNSALRQSHCDVEVVVVNDATPDDAMRVVREVQAADSRVKVVEHEKNQGSMWARRDGCRAATGEWMLFLDSDDELPLDAVERLLAAVSDDADIIVGQLLKHRADGREELIASRPLDSADHSQIFRALLSEKLKHSLCGKLFAASLLRSPQLRHHEDLNISEDGCLFYQLAALTRRIKTLDAVTYHYLENRQSVTHKHYTAKEVESIIIANREMTACCLRYPERAEEATRHCRFKMLSLYAERVPVATVTRLLAKHGMSHFALSFRNLRRLTFGQLWFLAKRYVYLRIPRP